MALDFFSEKNSVVAVLIYSTLLIQWTEKTSIDMIEPIQCWQVASWYFKCSNQRPFCLQIQILIQFLHENVADSFNYLWAAYQFSIKDADGVR